MRFSWYSIVYQTVVRRTGFQKKRRDHLEVSIIFKIGAVGILVSVLSQILKHSGREEQAFLVSFSGLLLVLFWIVPYIYELFKNIQQLFVLQGRERTVDILKISVLGAAGVLLGILLKDRAPEYVSLVTMGIGLS